MSNLIPGEIIPEQGEIELNLGKEVITVRVSNSGDRPVQVGSHYHFFEARSSTAVGDSSKQWLLHCPVIQHGGC